MKKNNNLKAQENSCVGRRVWGRVMRERESKKLRISSSIFFWELLCVRRCMSIVRRYPTGKIEDVYWYVFLF